MIKHNDSGVEVRVNIRTCRGAEIEFESEGAEKSSEHHEVFMQQPKSIEA